MFFALLGPLLLGIGFAAYSVALARARKRDRLPLKKIVLALLCIAALGCVILTGMQTLGRGISTFPVYEVLIALGGLTALGLATQPAPLSTFTRPSATHTSTPAAPAVSTPTLVQASSSTKSSTAPSSINPLAMILMRAETLKSNIEGNAKELSAESSPHLRRQLDRITHIINELKVLAADSDEEPQQTISLGRVLNESYALHEPRISKYSIDFELDPNLSQFNIQGQSGQLTQVFIHLLSNSLDAIQGSDSPWIKIQSEEVPDKIRIKVIDSGKRITDSISSRLMDPFFTTKPVGKGAGLGLSISKGIIEKHGGTLILDRSHPNTCFIVELPTKP